MKNTGEEITALVARENKNMTPNEIRAEAITEFAERLKNYYDHLNGQTYAHLVAYNIDTMAKELIEKGMKENGCK